MKDIRHFPEVTERVESGPIQFGDDWPGVWIRGDDALGMAGMLDLALQHLPATAEADAWIGRAAIEGLISSLRSCSVYGRQE
jgi:hypothetical protein